MTVRALTFDVFGTVVDWRSSVICEGQALAASIGLTGVDWGAFADVWRAGYAPAMDLVRRGDLPWTPLDDLHRRILDEILPQFGLSELREFERNRLNLVWHRLQPWPDAIEGLQRLRRRFVVASLSNGNTALLVNMATHSRIPWDWVLSAELVRRYKPDPEVYRMAAERLGVAPQEAMMVAAHPEDLEAAAGVGFQTAFVSRPLEYGPHGPVPSPPPGCDLRATDFHHLAAQLGV